MTNGQPPPENLGHGFLALVWEAAHQRAAAICAEVVVMACLLVGLTGLFLFVRLMIALGFPADRAKHFEDIEYYASLVVVTSFSLRFVFDSIISSLSRRQ